MISLDWNDRSAELNKSVSSGAASALPMFIRTGRLRWLLMNRTESPPEGSVWGSLLQIWKLLTRAERWRLLVITGLVCIQALLEIVGIGTVPAFAGALATPDKVLQHPLVGPWFQAIGVESQHDLLRTAGLALVAAFAVKAAYTLFTSWEIARFMQGFRTRLGARLFRAYMHAPYTFHLGRNPADLVRNANLEVDRVTQVVLSPAINMFAHTLIGACVVGLMLTVQPLVTVVGITMFAGSSYAFLMSVRRRSVALGRDAQTHRGKLIQAVNEGLGGFKEARVLRREAEFVNTFRTSNDQLAEAIKHRTITAAVIPPVLELVAVIGLTLVVALLFAVGMQSGDVLPILALYAAALLRLKQATSQAAGTINGLRYDHVTVNAVYSDLQALEGVADTTHDRPVRRHKLSKGIELKNVSFRYPNSENWALSNVNLKIPAGSSVALVGATGAGKSTLADLLLGLLVPSTGSVLVDGQDIHKDLAAWQTSIGYIPQSLYLMDASMRRNIAFGIPEDEIDDDRVREAARMAQLDEVLAGLPDGLETVLGDRGVRLSGGQRQRVCIARALYHNPDVLILDEATSALDNATEQRIVEELDAQRGDRTLVIIAHRLSTVKHCDKLYLLRNGTVEASGTYAELFRDSGGFQRLVAAER